MRYIIPVIFLICCRPVSSQVYEEPEFLPPLPPPVEEYCGDVEQVSEPVISYRISESCAITDIKAVGEYKYGTEQVRREVRDLSSKDTVRRFVSGKFVYFNEIRIELHRATERTAELVCTVDMMGKKVIDARIIRQKLIDGDRTVSYDEPVEVENNRLPNLGVFTYTNKVRYKTNDCPENAVHE